MLRSLGFGIEMVLVGAMSLFAVGILSLVLLGFRPLIISSGSMRPKLQIGDVVVTTWEPAYNLRVGDIVSFDDATAAGELVTHRVRSVTVLAGNLHVETRGDANRVSEVWLVPRGTLLRRTVYDVPEIGGVVSALGSPTVRYGLLGGVALAAAVTGLGVRRARRSHRPGSCV